MIGLYWKAAAAVLVGLVLTLALGNKSKEIGLLLILAVCAMIAVTALEFLEPVMGFLYELEAITALDGTILKNLLQLAGIGLIGEICNLICADAGCGSLGKGLQLLSSAVILWLSVPIFRSLTTLVRDIMGAL